MTLINLVLISYSLILISTISTVTSLIAYDCSHTNISYTTLSLVDIAECSDDKDSPVIHEEKIQLLELSMSTDIMIRSCLVEVERVVYHCGMHSHNSIVKGGLATYRYHLGKDDCIGVHETGRLNLFRNTPYELGLHGITTDQQRKQTHTLAGRVSENGACDGGFYSDPFGSFHNVVAQGQVSVSISHMDGSVSFEDDALHVPGGVKCRYSKGTCEDSHLGEMFWDTIPSDVCSAEKVNVLFTGWSNVSESKGVESTSKIYTVNNGDMLFSLRITGKYNLCNLDSYTTEHPKLIVVRSQGQAFYHKKKRITPSKMDLFTYVNSKFVHIERNIQTNMEALYKTIIRQSCELERHVLKTRLHIAGQNPNEFALLTMESLGYTGMVVGEVVYISKCMPVHVTIRKADTCYKELPVLYNNQTYFMVSKYHLLQKHGEQIDCNSIYNGMYKLEGKWYRTYPTIHDTQAPQQLIPQIKPVWSFQSTQNMAKAGIYSDDDLAQLRDHIMYGTEREAIQTIIGRQMMGKQTDLQGLHTYSMLDEEGFDHLSNRFSEKVWGWFTSFGTVISGFMGIFICARIVKWILDTFLNMLTLHKVYGLSFALFAAVWDSLTLCMLRHKMKPPPYEDIELDGSTPNAPLRDEHPTVEPNRVIETTMPNITIYPSLSPNYNGN